MARPAGIHRVGVHHGHVGLGIDLVDPEAVFGDQAVDVEAARDRMSIVYGPDGVDHAPNPAASGDVIGRVGEEVGLVAQVPHPDGGVPAESSHDRPEQQRLGRECDLIRVGVPVAVVDEL